MNRIWRLIKYSVIFHKVNMAYLLGVSLCVYSIITFLNDTNKEIGEQLMTYSMYVIFMNSMLKAAPKSSATFDLKHLLGLPLTRMEIIFVKSFTDIVILLPVICLAMYGYYLSEYPYNFAVVFAFTILALGLMNIIILYRRIDGARAQHVKGSFISNFKHLQKFLDFMFISLLGTTVFLILKVTADKNTILLQYGVGVILITGVFYMTHKTLKLFKDESLSYFLMKRDGFSIGWKVLFVIIPLVVVTSSNKEAYTKLLKTYGANDSQLVELQFAIDKMNNIKQKRILLAILENDMESFDKYLNEDGKLALSAQVLGNYPAHVAARKKRVVMFKKIVEIDPESVNKVGKYRLRTPIFSALKNCDMEMLQVIADTGGNIDQQDKDGITPMIFAASKNCYGGVLKLQAMGAKEDILTNKGYNVANYIKSNSGIRAFVNVKPIVKKKTDRGVASKVKR